MVLVYARWWGWHGDWFWGPRFFLIASLPASFALAANLAEAGRHPLWRNLIVLGILTLSFWVGADGMVFGQSNLEFCWGPEVEDRKYQSLSWYVPEWSALWRPLVVRDPQVWHPPPEGPQPPGVREGVYFLVFGAAYLYLALPLAARCARQAGSAARDFWRARVAPGPWRF
jgi:hypothetical protein